MTINYPVVYEIGDGVFSINEFGYDHIYVVVGRKRALVIDTGAGCFRTRAAVRRLTFLPYDVVLTHGHIAQAGGIGQYESIYAYPGEYGAAMQVCRVDSMNFCLSVQKSREPGIWEDRMPIDGIWDGIPAINELYEGLEFDLGGRTVRTVRTSSHTKGSCSFIDDKSRIAFVGDAVSRDLDATECHVTSAIRGLYNLHAHSDEFDRIYSTDTGNACAKATLSLPQTVLRDCIGALKSILTDSADTCPEEEGSDIWTAKFGQVKVRYRRDRLYEPDEEKLPI